MLFKQARITSASHRYFNRGSCGDLLSGMA
jgi:hypothetical protein